MAFDAVEFRMAVMSIVAAVPRGKVVTYGTVARLAGWPAHSRLAVCRLAADCPAIAW